MKTKHTLLLIAFGYCLDFFAGLKKIMHQPNADTIFIIAAILKIAGVLLLVYKITSYPKFKDFMNW